MRGDILRAARNARSNFGSPPRAWGHLLQRPRLHRCGRFTPTCVGTSRDRRPAEGPRAVHPHVRGDIAWASAAASRSAGSPPRAWGHRARRPRSRCRRRFTPTCVGTSSAGSEYAGICPVHPHVRGDIDDILIVLRPQYGSPPRAWGHRAVGHGRAAQHRFTPTCVGTSHHSPFQNMTQVRFTPTCVGTSRGRRDPRGSAAVHPHVRGDIPSASRSISACCGSPPREWGHRASSCRSRCAASVHPHVRGDIGGAVSQ